MAGSLNSEFHRLILYIFFGLRKHQVLEETEQPWC